MPGPKGLRVEKTIRKNVKKQLKKQKIVPPPRMDPKTAKKVRNTHLYRWGNKSFGGKGAGKTRTHINDWCTLMKAFKAIEAEIPKKIRKSKDPNQLKAFLKTKKGKEYWERKRGLEECRQKLQMKPLQRAQPKKRLKKPMLFQKKKYRQRARKTRGREQRFKFKFAFGSGYQRRAKKT